MKKGPALVLLIERVPLPYPVTSTAIGIVMFLVELFISKSLRLQWVDLVSGLPLVPVTVVAVPYVLAIFCWAWHAYEPMLMKLRESFEVEQLSFERILRDYFQKQVYNDARWLIACLAIGAPFIIISDIVVWTTDWIPWPLLKLMFSEPLMFANIAVLETVLAFLLSIGAYLVFVHSRFVRRISQYPLRLEILEPVRYSNLQPITRFSLKAAFAYFVGISVAMALTVGPSTFFFLVESILYVLGLLLFFVPQYALHSCIRKAKIRLLESISKRFEEEYRKGEEFVRVLVFSTLFTEVERLREWPFSLSFLNQLVLSALIPVLTSMLKILRVLP